MQGAQTVPPLLAGGLKSPRMGRCWTLRRITSWLTNPLFQEAATQSPVGWLGRGSMSSSTDLLTKTIGEQNEKDISLPTYSWSGCCGVCSGRSWSWNMRGLLPWWRRWRRGTCSLSAFLVLIFWGNLGSTPPSWMKNRFLRVLCFYLWVIKSSCKVLFAQKVHSLGKPQTHLFWNNSLSEIQLSDCD